MALAFLFDHCAHGAVVRGLRERGIDVLTAQDEDRHELPDSELLQHAALLGRVLYTNDDDLLKEAAKAQRQGVSFPGLVYAHPLRLTIGLQIADLELIAHGYTADEIENDVVHLPL